MSNSTLLFVVNHARWFLTHRLPIAERAQDAGFNVHVATPPSEFVGAIVSRGMEWHPIRLRRAGRSPIGELRILLDLLRLYRSLRPSIVHHISMKPVLYGTIAARMVRVPAVLNAMTGLGHLFLSDAVSDRWLRRIVGVGFRFAVRHRNMRVLVQNPDDLDLLVKLGWLKRENTILMPSGVDTETFRPRDQRGGDADPTVLFPGRMLRTKGVVEFIEAAAQLQSRGVHARFVLIGGPDEENPASLTEEEIRTAVDRGILEYLGERSDMADLFRTADIVCLPSYREGMPKVLLEAAASGVAIVTTDTAGCRDVVTDGVNGLLVPVRSVDALAAALQRLIFNPVERRAMGACGRQRAVAEFSAQQLAQATLSTYRMLLSPEEIPTGPGKQQSRASALPHELPAAPPPRRTD